MQPKSWPDQVFSGRYGVCHVQGIATDGAYFYLSFTTMLLKIDLRGNPVGSVTGLTGHLGCIASAPDGTVIGSLEYKQDAIGRGILAALGKTERREDAFFVARFDTGRIDRMNMDAQTDGVMQLARLTDVCEDYAASVENDGRTVKHRYGCSGIDGITCLPDPAGEPSVLVAYGIYGDETRTDNDRQVMARYPWTELTAALAADGEIRCAEKCFAETGNTTYGIQNLEYDPYTGLLMAAVYPGTKPCWPNYPMFWLNPAKHVITPEGSRMALADQNAKASDGTPVGLCLQTDASTGVTGVDFPLGSTGIIALGDGTYYFSEDGSVPTGSDRFYTTIVRYRLTPSGFERMA